jgi:SAM-dependent methyltransferase
VTVGRSPISGLRLGLSVRLAAQITLASKPKNRPEKREVTGSTTVPTTGTTQFNDHFDQLGSYPNSSLNQNESSPWETLAVEAFSPRAVGAAYSAVANDYAEAFADDLYQLPVDRAALDAFLGHVGHSPAVADVGCGPGQVGRYLADRGAQVVCLDLATEMSRLAGSRLGLSAVCADMRALPLASGSLSGAVAFYSIQHLRRDELGGALVELRRVLARGGLLLIAAHLGEGEVFVDEFLGHHIEMVGGTLYGADELSQAVERQDYSVEDVRFRDPLPHEHQSKRIYLLARTE